LLKEHIYKVTVDIRFVLQICDLKLGCDKPEGDHQYDEGYAAHQHANQGEEHATNRVYN